MRIEVPLEVIDRHLIAILKLPVIFCVLLNCIVCQVNIFVGKIINRVLFRAGPKITVSIEEAFLIPVNGCHQAITPYIKFPAINQQRFFYVFLHYHCASALRELGFEDLLYFVERVRHMYPAPAIRVLARLDDPHVLAIFFSLEFVEGLQEGGVV